MSGLGIAFKEWAVICQALAEGRQSIILRKGGIAESGGTFRVEHARFWLYPTYVHQQESGIIESARPLLELARAQKPAEGMIHLTHFAEVVSVQHLDELTQALALSPLHIWSRETIEARFHYRAAGLFALLVRVYRAATRHELPETPTYAGCKSWVELERELDTTGAVPVVSDDAFASIPIRRESV